MSEGRKLLLSLPGHTTREGGALTPLTSQRMRTTIATVAFPALKQMPRVVRNNQLAESLLEAKGKHEI